MQRAQQPRGLFTEKWYGEVLIHFVQLSFILLAADQREIESRSSWMDGWQAVALSGLRDCQVVDVHPVT